MITEKKQDKVYDLAKNHFLGDFPSSLPIEKAYLHIGMYMGWIIDNGLYSEYFEDEACFVFVNEGEVSVRAQTDYIDLDSKHAILAKCLNYFFETNDKQKESGDGVEVIAVILHPSQVEELFESRSEDRRDRRQDHFVRYGKVREAGRWRSRRRLWRLACSGDRGGRVHLSPR